MKGRGKKYDWWWRGGMFIVSHIMPFLLKITVLRWLTKVWMPIGEKVAVIGGDMAGCELAEFLVQRQRRVTILETSTDMAVDMSIGKRWNFMQQLRDRGVSMFKNVDILGITPAGVKITDGEGKQRTVRADTIVISGGTEPNKTLAESLDGTVPQVISIGDCTDLRLIHGSVEDGYRAALSI